MTMSEPVFDDVREEPERQVAFVIQRGDRVTLLTPYEPAFLEDLKDIPYRWRSWDGGARAWTVREPYVEEAVTLCCNFFAVEFLRPADAES